MASSPLVSIITPTYNHEKYIGACIESVLRQTYTNWELIIVNDGSTDRTAEIVREYAARDPRIKQFDQENAGIFRLAENYNFALQKAQGQYIAVLEGDDVWVPGKLALQVPLMVADEEIVLCWGRATSVIEEVGNVHENHPRNAKKNGVYYNNQPAGSIFNIIFDDFLPPLTFLIRRNFLEKIGGFIQTHSFPAVDLPTVLALSKLGKFHFVDAVLGSWRLHASQTTKSNSVNIVLGSSKIVREHFRNLDPQTRKSIRYDERFIDHFYNKLIVIGYARSGRFKLIKKDFKGARKDYIQAMFFNGLAAPGWKLRALTGYLLSFFRTDVEGLARMLGKKSYRS